MGREVTTGIVVEGEDRGGTKVMKNVSKEAGRMEGRLDAVKKGVAGLPDQFGKAAGAMMLMQSASSQMGAGVADAANKLAALGLLAMTGGPIGIGIAAITAAVIAATAAWEVFTRAQKEAERMGKELAEGIRQQTARLRDQKSELDDMIDVLEHYGETISEQKTRRLQEELEEETRWLLKMGEEHDARKLQLQDLRDEIGLRKEGNAFASRDMALRVKSTEQLKRDTAALDARLSREKSALENLETSRERLVTAVSAQEAMNIVEEEANKTKEKGIQVSKRREELERARADRIREEGELVIAALEREEAAEADALAARLAAIDRFTQARDRLRQQDLAREEQAARTRVALDEQLAAQKLASAQAAAAAIAAQTTAVLTNAKMAADAEEDTAKKSEAFARAAAKQVIQILAVKGAAAAFEKAVEQFGMPYGAIIGAVVSAAAFALVNAFAEKLALGGFVRGGIPGRDSVLASLTPGEYVASTSEVAGFRKFATRLLGEKEGRQLATAAGMERVAAVEPMRSGRGGTTIINQMWQPENVAMMRLTRRQSRTVRKLRARGMY